MIKNNEDGTFSFITDSDAEKLHKYDEIVKLLDERSPYKGNRETCDLIRAIVKRGEKK